MTEEIVTIEPDENVTVENPIVDENQTVEPPVTDQNIISDENVVVEPPILDQNKVSDQNVVQDQNKTIKEKKPKKPHPETGKKLKLGKNKKEVKTLPDKAKGLAKKSGKGFEH